MEVTVILCLAVLWQESTWLFFCDGCGASFQSQAAKTMNGGVGGVTPDVVSPGQAAFLAVSWMGGKELPMTFSTVLTTLCRDFQSEALQAPDQKEMQLVSMLSIVPL